MHKPRHHSFFILFVQLIASSATARGWFVNPKIGKIHNEGSQGFPLPRIQDAIDRARPQDRILLFPPQSIYRQSIKLATTTEEIPTSANMGISIF